MNIPNIPTLIAIAAVAAAIVLAVRHIIHNRKEGKSCAGCPYRDSCGEKSRNPCGECSAERSRE